MTSLIEQIQRAALDPNIPVSTLLRQVKLAAAKLQLGETEDWVEKELNGYLSRSPKVLQQLSEPEVFGCHAGLATCLLRRQRQHPGCGIGGEGID
jgi:hypothetical protein